MPSFPKGQFIPETCCYNLGFKGRQQAEIFGNLEPVWYQLAKPPFEKMPRLAAKNIQPRWKHDLLQVGITGWVVMDLGANSWKDTKKFGSEPTSGCWRVGWLVVEMAYMWLFEPATCHLEIFHWLVLDFLGILLTHLGGVTNYKAKVLVSYFLGRLQFLRLK